ncbi:DUF6527 family protein [Streptacidiphilus sp. N1-12]|uniref:DUF6527 family protein n=2 Tax=Streptacidiphilus alkalitolerans TaxID=3342712 RepID=A0ABV6VKD2_9ACTN
MTAPRLTHVFIDNFPDQLEPGTLYISIPYTTAAHLCCCGCGHEVVTPLSPTDWQLTFDGQSVSLHPSIGNWSLACQSHYWIRTNTVHWAPRWSPERIATNRTHRTTTPEPTPAPSNPPTTLKDRLAQLLHRRSRK